MTSSLSLGLLTIVANLFSHLSPFTLLLFVSFSFPFFFLRSLWVYLLANCIPQCQNGGMCLRPQLCVCKSGSSGKACEEKSAQTPPFPAVAGTGPSTGQHTVVQRPIPQQQLPADGFAPSRSSRNMAQMKLTVRSSQHLNQPHYIQQHIQQQWVGPGNTHLLCLHTASFCFKIETGNK